MEYNKNLQGIGTALTSDNIAYTVDHLSIVIPQYLDGLYQLAWPSVNGPDPTLNIFSFGPEKILMMDGADLLGGEMGEQTHLFIRENGNFHLLNPVSGTSHFLRMIPSDPTISSGDITLITSYAEIRTEGGAASDDLDNVFPVIEGQIIVIGAKLSADTVVVKDGTGNLQLAGNIDFSLTSIRSKLILIGRDNRYDEISRSDNN